MAMPKSLSQARHKWQALSRLVKEEGLVWAGGFLAHRFINRRRIPQFEDRARAEIDAWIAASDRPVHIYLSTLDWSYPYQQRPQHIARSLAARGERVIYVTPTIGYDRVMATREVEAGVLLTPHRGAALAAAPNAIVHTLSTDASLDRALVDSVTSRGGLVIYDYIDALDDAVSSGALDAARRDLHRHLLQTEEGIVVLASADVLLKEVAAKRSHAYGLVTNGADTAPFLAAKRAHTDLRADFAAVKASGRPVIGYYGSFATWFDYELVNAVARLRPNYAFVMIGPDLDGTRAQLDTSLPNLTVLPAMAYTDLPRHGTWFDVCLVPFLINEITLATSPLKIFEYMALGKPTVSTDMPECRKYKSIETAMGAGPFAEAVDRVLERGKDPAFVALAIEEALENSWERKVDHILALAADASAVRAAN